jgi:fibronectin type 3 domain-containing protein
MRTNTPNVTAPRSQIVEQLEQRLLLSAAIHTAVQKISGTPHSALTARPRHHLRHTTPPKAVGSIAASTTGAMEASSVSPSAAPTQAMPGLNESVYHGDNAYNNSSRPVPNPNSGLTDATLGGDNAAVNRVAAYAASNSANYTFVNTYDQFAYSGGSTTLTSAFLANGVYGGTGDAAGAALNDAADVDDTILDAEGYFLTPSANDGGTYTVAVGTADDLVAVYVGGNGTPGSGTLVASAGWQGANAGTPGFQIALPAGADSTNPSSIPVEILFGNGFGGAFLDAVSGSNPATGVQISDPQGTEVTSFQTTATNEPAPSTPPTLNGTAGNGQIVLNWTSCFLASGYSVWRSQNGGQATQVATGLTALTYTDSNVTNGTTYTYYVTADNSGGSKASNNAVEKAQAEPTGPVTFLTAARTNASTVDVSFTAPQFGTNYTITRSTSLNGTQTTLTPAGGQTGTTFTDSNAPTTGGSNYYYTVTSVNSAGSSTPVTVFVGQGDGFAADYYTSSQADTTQNGSTKPLTGDASNAVLSFERVDSTLSVPPANTPPGWNSIQPNVNNDFAVRWTAEIQAPLTGYYTFSVNNADDREQVYVYDASTLTNGSPTPVNISPAGHTMSGYGDTYATPVAGAGGLPYQFIAGQQYLVQVDYNQGFGGLNANLSWAASSTPANQAAGTYDLMTPQAVPTDDANAPTPQFSTIDANTVLSGTPDTHDSSYYTFTSQAGNQSVILAWDSVAADSYNLYRATAAGGPYAKINSSPIAATANGAALSYTDTGLANGTAYYYILTGADVEGETAITLATGATSGPTTSATPMAVAPATPTNVVVVGTNSQSAGVEAHINFPAVAFASSYIIQRAPESPAGSGTPGTFATIPNGGNVTGGGSTLTFVDSDPALSATANYFYRVIAANGGLQSAPSTPVEMQSVGALATEGTVEVQVEASAYATGTTSSIVNAGNQGGSFSAAGGAINVGPVTDANGTAYQAFQFNGSNSATSSFNAPADLTGNSTRSIELWVDDPTIDNVEETMVSWSHRGGNPDGSNMSFSYGSQYGVGLWGGEYDLTWNNTAPGVSGGAPAANIWHYLVFTYDGAYDQVYLDGMLYLQQPVAGGALSTFAGFPVNLAAQNSSTTSGFLATLNGSFDLASARIEGGALTSSDVMNNYVVGVPGRQSATSAPTTAPTLNPLPTNGQLTPSWSYDPNAFSYDVYRSDPSHPTPVAIAANVTSLSYADTAVTAGVTYTYYVTSVNNIGQGPPSNSESGSIRALTTSPILSTPSVGNNEVTLNWSADPNAASYDVYRSDAGNPTPVAIASGLQTLTYTDSSVVNGTGYTYYVASVNSVSQGPPSNSQTATPEPPGPFAPLNITAHGANAQNQNLNAAESVLTPQNVNPTDFGKQYEDHLDGADVIAEPLYMQNVNVTTGAGQGVHSVVFIATEADDLYSIDANTGAVLWQDNFTDITSPTNLTPTSGVTTIQQSDIANNPDVGSQLGILATPAIDPATGIMYLNANTKEIRPDGKHFVQRLWAISISNGAPAMNPAVIGDTIAPNGLSNTGPYKYVAGPIVNGTGNNNPANSPANPVYPNTDGWTSAPGGQSGYVIAFNAIEQMERAAVTLINGSVYLGFASHGDNGPYYGWVLGYNASTLALNAVFNTTPTYEPSSAVGASTPFQSLGGVWMSGAAIATDGTSLYLSTGNGAFDGTPSNFDANGFPIDHDYGDSLLKLTPDSSTVTSQNGNGWGLKVSDYFTPSNQFQLNSLDLDLGSGGVDLLPNNILDNAANPMLVAGGKESRVYLIDRNNMGKYNFSYPTGASNANPAPYDRVVAEYANNGLNTGGKQIYSTAAYYDGNIYVGINGAPALELNVAAMISGAAIAPVQTSLIFGYPAESFEISSDATSNGIAWALNPGGSDLLAYDASHFTTPIYDSNTAAGDALNGSIHFHVPTIANGMAYAGSRGGGLNAYGLKLSYLQSNPAYFSAPTNLSATVISSGDAHLTWASNSSLATEFRVDRAPAGTTTWTTLAYVGNTNTSYDDSSIGSSSAYIYRVLAISGANSTMPSNTATLSSLAVAVTSAVVNGNLPSLAGVQRSMVNSIVYSFNQAVTLAATNAFTIGVHSGQTGTVPTLAWIAINPDANGASTQWIVNFSGTGVTGGSIANGVYDIALNSAAVTSESNPTASVTPRATDTFYRLFGDINGDGRVNNADYAAFLNTNGLKSGQTDFDVAFDSNADGRVNNLDYGAFLTDNGVRYTGFTATV